MKRPWRVEYLVSLSTRPDEWRRTSTSYSTAERALSGGEAKHFRSLSIVAAIRVVNVETGETHDA